jgi:hypothetical protein
MKRLHIITDLEGNANQMHNEIPLHAHEAGYQETASTKETVEKLEFLYFASRNVKWQAGIAGVGEVCQFLTK